MSRTQRGAAVALATAFVLATLFSTVVASGSTATFDRELRLHPYLQYGAATEPDRNVRAIVQKLDPTVDSGRIAAAADGRVIEEFAFIGSFVIEAPLSALPLLAAHSDVAYISPDGPVQGGDPGQQTVEEGADGDAAEHESPDGEASEGDEGRGGIDSRNLKTAFPFAVHAPEVWNDDRFEAGEEGISVAVVDTGVNAGHDDFSNRVLAVSTNPRATDAGDRYGHGTHVAGIIAGYDGSGTTGEYIGIAPTSRVISVKIADDDGVARESDLLRGLQWVYEHREKHAIRVVNLSVRSGTPSSYLTSPTAAAAERLWFSGIVVVAAAGNEGGGLGAGWFAPANDPYVITVGCLDDGGTAALDDDGRCAFSVGGSAPEGHVKPELVAPGRRIVATLAGPDAVLARQFPERVVDDRYVRLSGTSMSAAAVSGAAALLLERYVLTPDEVKWLLSTTARAYPGQPDGAGLVDISAALEQAASGTIRSANQASLMRAGGSAPLDALLVWEAAYWDAAYWDAAYWDAAYWDAAYWDAAYWDAAYWDAAYWDAAYWDAAFGE